MLVRSFTENDTEDLRNLPAYDFTKLSAINTCPTWGIIRYGLHKTIYTPNRAMALEAGEACHQVFAAIRLIDLLRHAHSIYTEYDAQLLSNAIHRRGTELFGKDRYEQFLAILSKDDDEYVTGINACLHILETSGFYDDPGDKRRTLSKLSEACIAYYDRYEMGTNIPYVSSDLLFVGVENKFDLLIIFSSGTCVRFYGRIDGVHLYRNNKAELVIEENKTSSRLNDAWEESFQTSHQVTGYMVAATTIAGFPVSRCRVRGLAIPQPRVSEYDGIKNTLVSRHQTQFNEWAEWFEQSVEMFNRYKDTPLRAPKYTHSCNRYFRPCSFVPLCASPMEDREELFDSMYTEEWSPLHEKEGTVDE